MIVPPGFNPPEPNTWRKGFIMDNGDVVAWSRRASSTVFIADGEDALGIQDEKGVSAWFTINPDNILTMQASPLHTNDRAHYVEMIEKMFDV